MKHALRVFAWLLLASLVSLAVIADPLDQPAQASPLADKRLINGIVHAGPDRLVAVGQRGHILFSDDAARSWKQAKKVPVSSDLTAVQFVDAKIGYAVGHDGVVLRSGDGGLSWTKVLDGRGVNRLVLQQLNEMPSGPERDRLLLEAQRNMEQGPDKPFLDLYFTSASQGFIVGAYNLILETLDGGHSWQSWYAQTDNDKLLNLYAIRAHRGGIYIAGEAGLLLKLDARTRRFTALHSAYAGSYFGLVDAPAGLIAFGMRGNALLSRDEGASWQPLATQLQASITAAALAGDGAVLLADQSGGIARSADGGAGFVRVPLPAAMPLAALAVTPTGLILGGPRGLRTAP